MKHPVQKSTDRRQKVIDSMAKKFADHGSVQQIITNHRKKMRRSTKAIYVIAGITVCTMIITGLVTVGVIKSPLEQDGKIATQHVKNTIDLLRADLNISAISPDLFARYCKDYLIQYDSLPEKYKTSFSTTSSTEVYGAICDVWPMLPPRSRQNLLHDLPRIAEEHERRSLQSPK